MKKWLWVLIAIFTAGPAPARAEITDQQVSAFVEALRLAAPQTGREDDGLHSAWQIRPENITRWSKRCGDKELTVQEFEADEAAARKVLSCVMGEVLRKQAETAGGDEAMAVQRAAAWWMTGDPEKHSDSSAQAYVQKVLKLYQEQVAGPPPER